MTFLPRIDKSKSIVIVSEFFYPNKTGSSKVLTELAEDLVSYGMEVSVVTSRNIYNEEKRKLLTNDNYKGINISRIWTSNFNKNSSIGRIINYFSFTLSVLFNLLFSKSKEHVLFVSNPPTVPVVGYFINLLKKQEYSYLIHDLYPDIAVAMGVVNKDSVFVKMFNLINDLAFKKVKNVIVLGFDMKEKILNKGVSENRIKIITNWADKTKIKPVKKENSFSKRENLSDKFVILYTGNMGKFHQLEIIVDAAEKLKGNNNIAFVFVGEGYKKDILMELAKEKQLNNVFFYPYQSNEDYEKVLATGDLMITSLEKGVEGTAVPSKTYSYLAAGKPIVGIMSKDSEIGSLIIKNNLGITIDDNNSGELVDFIIKLSNNEHLSTEIKNNVIQLFDQNYQRNIVTKKYYDLFNE
jgi:glycosyltransferase involved in cell wall biosynthesis